MAKIGFLRASALALSLLLLGACSSVKTTNPGAIGVERSQFMSSLVSEQALQQQAASQYQQILDQAKAQKKLDPNAAQTQRVQQIASKLIAQASVFRPDARAWQWQVHVLDSPDLNAWCMPGGKIAVYTGLLQKIQPTDAELAAVMGHEIAHALREHARERVSQQMAANVGLSVLAAVSGSKAATNLGSTLSQVMFTLPNSRANETEADLIGVELAARAGYDPRAAVSLWQKMAQIPGSKPPEMLSTHPSSATRIADLQRASARVLGLYQGQQ